MAALPRKEAAMAGEPFSSAPKLRTVLIGSIALALWFAMLWFMFGDVL
jgi:hypothetical protein